MWSGLVVVLPPRLDCQLRIVQAGKVGLVQALVSRPSIDALDVGVLVTTPILTGSAYGQNVKPPTYQLLG